MIRFNGQTFKNLGELYEYVKQHPELLEYAMEIPDFKAVWNVGQARDQYESGQIGANDLLGTIGNNDLGGRLSMTPEMEKWLDNQIARENTQQQQNFELQARDTSLLSAGSQLQQLGLSGSSVIQTGGASAGVQGSTASTSHKDIAGLRQQMKINSFNQKMGLAKSLIGAASSMASSGIYGAALGAIKHSASAVAGAAAHSALPAMKATNYNGDVWADLEKSSKQAERVQNKQLKAIYGY